MTFTTFTFVVFFLLFFTFYWLLNKNLRYQNLLIFVGSYIFYGWWDYRFLALIFISSMIDYTIGLSIYRSTKQNVKNVLMALCLLSNLGILFYFKYYNFFIDSFSILIDSLGINSSNLHIDVILPVGISFYTFQTLSYSLDIYKNKLKPTENLIDFLSFVSFFPQLVAGPIERASALLPQIEKPRSFNYELAASGARLILYGFFKKLVIADPMSLRVTEIYSNPSSHSGIESIIAGIFFMIQLYLDFSAYSDIAKGTARLLGFDLMKNFATPFFSTSIPEFWRKWHISLTTWFRDYLFLPLVKLRFENTLWRIFSTIVLFVVIGIWHGANMTFVWFGFLMGVCYIPSLVAKNQPAIKNALKFFNTHTIGRPIAMLFTNLLLCLIGILFRASSLDNALEIYKNIFIADTFWHVDEYIHRIFPLVIGFMIYEFFMQNKEYCFDIKSWPTSIRYTTYVGLTMSILLYGYFAEEPFYYFKF